MAKTLSPRPMPLDAAELRRRAPDVPHWDVDEQRLAREWTFKDFAQALAFVNRVGDEAEELGHHPDIHLTEARKVRIESSTHDAGGVTARDVELARRIDALA